ncbi:MAG: SRPBCC domain-containing protein [Polyangiales bacterium]
MSPTDAAIRWPAEFDPARAPIHVRNERVMTRGAPAVWAWLVRATAWPTYYANSSNVRLEGGGDELSAGQVFRWKTFGVRLRSVVEECVPTERLAWNARGLGVWAYHAWLLLPHGDGCRVITEETQFGLLSRLGSALMPERMHRQHQAWLDALEEKSRSGAPGP